MKFLLDLFWTTAQQCDPHLSYVASIELRQFKDLPLGLYLMTILITLV